MSKKEITIGTRKLPVAFNITTLLTFEEITDRPFFGEEFQKTKARLALIFAAVYTADPDTTFSIDDLMKSEDWQETAQAFKTVLEMAEAFFTVPKVVADAESRESDPDVENGEKN